MKPGPSIRVVYRLSKGRGLPGHCQLNIAKTKTCSHPESGQGQSCQLEVSESIMGTDWTSLSLSLDNRTFILRSLGSCPASE